MVGQNTLKTYNFQGIEEYFNMIVESYLNGQISQCKEQIKSLSSTQREDFFKYLQETAIEKGHVTNISLLIIKT